MKLTIRESAAILGCSPRTVRARIARGELPAVKHGGRWLLDRSDLPLTDSQRQTLQTRADAIRATVDAALPSRAALRHGDRRRSVVDLDPFRRGAALLAELRATPEAPSGAAPLLEDGLLALAEAHHLFAPPAKLAALRRARAALGRAVGVLGLHGEAWHPRLRVIEDELLPHIAGLCRSAERRQRRGLPGRYN